MYKIFELPSQRARGTIRHPQWVNYQRGLTLASQTVVDFYSTHNMAVRSDHLLYRLLAAFDVQGVGDLPLLYAEVVGAGLNRAMALKMTSSIYSGDSHKGWFYGPGVDEVYIAHEARFDYRNAYENWERAVAVESLTHPFTDLALDLPNGLNRSNEKGLAVIAINVPMLLIQYRGFLDEQDRRAKENDNYARLTPYQFIHRYVLPGMVHSHLDAALINRYNALLYDEPINDRRPNHSFFITDWGKRVGEYQRDVIELISTRTLNISEILHSLPLATAYSGFEYAPLPQMLGTRQVNWALMLARLPLMELVLKSTRLAPGNANQREFNQLARTIERYRRDGVLKGVLPSALHNHVLWRIDRAYHLAMYR